MSRRAYLIESCNVRTLQRIDRPEEIAYFEPHVRLPDDDKPYMPIDGHIEHQHCPIIKVSSSTRDDLYIAYTKEVEELLDRPYSALHESNEWLQQAWERSAVAAYNLRYMSLWNRIKFVFMGPRIEAASL